MAAGLGIVGGLVTGLGIGMVPRRLGVGLSILAAGAAVAVAVVLLVVPLIQGGITAVPYQVLAYSLVMGHSLLGLTPPPSPWFFPSAYQLGNLAVLLPLCGVAAMIGRPQGGRRQAVVSTIGAVTTSLFLVGALYAAQAAWQPLNG